MPTTDPRIDAYIAKSPEFAQPILRYIRKAVHTGCPDVEETLKWSSPTFMYKGMLCGMAAFKQHCMFGFWKHSLLKAQGLLKEKSMFGQYGRLTSLKDLPPEKTLIKYVKAAADLNDKGIKVPRRPTAPKKPLKTPPDLAAALKKSAKARATFEAFSPSNKREYIEWLTDAKSDETRARRLDTALEWLAEGKTRNWKYERK